MYFHIHLSYYYPVFWKFHVYNLLSVVLWVWVEYHELKLCILSWVWVSWVLYYWVKWSILESCWVFIGWVKYSGDIFSGNEVRMSSLFSISVHTYGVEFPLHARTFHVMNPFGKHLFMMEIKVGIHGHKQTLHWGHMIF